MPPAVVQFLYEFCLDFCKLHVRRVLGKLSAKLIYFILNVVAVLEGFVCFLEQGTAVVCEARLRQVCNAAFFLYGTFA